MQLTASLAGKRPPLAEEGGEELEHRRTETRFLRLENMLSGARAEDMALVRDRGSSSGSGESDDDDDDGWIASTIGGLLAIFRGTSSSSSSSSSLSGGGDVDAMAMAMAIIEDDVRHAFQDAMREAISSALLLDDASDDGDGGGTGGGGGESGVELFMKPSTASSGKRSNGTKGAKGAKANGRCADDDGELPSGASSSMMYTHMHLGMRNNADAARLLRKWQGRRISLSMRLPPSLANRFRSRESDSTPITPSSASPFYVDVVTGKLFLDYADVMLPKGRTRSGVPRDGRRREGSDRHVDEHSPPSSSALSSSSAAVGGPECTSTTDHVKVPGLILIRNYASEDEERVLMAALSGPHAPWAPPQHTPSGGVIRRRVQHYGYVFDYASADVLRRNEEEAVRRDDDGRTMKSSSSVCPPMPSMLPSRHPVSEMPDADVEKYIEHAVRDVMGWEVLAGIIERTRRFDFAAASPYRHPHINQLTVNEYVPGQGIGSHIDTETAFDDGILIITLNGGIVMEFRKVIDDDASAKTNDGCLCKNSSNKIQRNKIQERKLVYLPPRSLMLLSGDARYKWEHMIVSRMTDTVDGTVLPRKMRVSLTLRTALSLPKEGEGRRQEAVSPLPHYESSSFPPRWGQLSDAAAAAAAAATAESQNGNGSSNNTSSLPHNTDNRSDLVTPATESKHVHAVYDAIATQWHHTRGKRGVLWPGATLFLENLPKGSVVADVGCGDGKYFAAITAASSYVIGTDISEPLLKTAASATGEDDAMLDGPQYQRLSKEKRALSLRPAVAVADCIHLPLRSKSFDAAICIAVMHHLSTEGRRMRCLAELHRIVKVGGLINVMAWALEQEDDSKRKFHGTDVLVPFNAQPKYLLNSLSSTLEDEEGNVESRSIHAAVDTLPKGKGVAQMMAEQYTGAEFDSKKNLVVFQRYCHMYRRGELEYLCGQVPGLEVIESSYEKGNHVVLLRVA